MNMAIMMIDSNAIIGMLTLFVTCIPGIWFLLRCRERRQSLRHQLFQDPETGFSHSVRDVLLDTRFAISSPPVLLAFPSTSCCCCHLFTSESSTPPEAHGLIRMLTIATVEYNHAGPSVAIPRRAYIPSHTSTTTWRVFNVPELPYVGTRCTMRHAPVNT